jgi:ferric-dicitrate binding protein FerR (iron transport regulator)
MLDQLHHQINSASGNKVGSRFLQTNFYRIFSRVAAILILPLILFSAYFFVTQMNPIGKATSEIREIYTKPGTRTKIELADGTKVWLNDGTTFRYPERFSDDLREVFVDGEAYFEVEADSSHPFVVKNPIMNTVVTGTHFNLNAYSSDEYFEATLLEGKICLERNNQTIKMIQGEQVQFDSELEEIIRKEVNPRDASAWVDGKLVFRDEKLGTVIKKLGRWYNVEIILANKEMADFLVTGTFENEKLDQTLNLISLALPVRFEYKNENNPTEIQRTVIMKKK